MHVVYFDTMIWVKAFFIAKKGKKVNNFPKIRNYDPNKIKIELSPLALYELLNKIVENEKISNFCKKNPHLDIFRCSHDIDKINISAIKKKTIGKEVQTLLINNVPSVYTSPDWPDIEKDILAGLVEKSLAYDIQLIDLIHAFLSDIYKCNRFVTSDESLLRSLSRMKRAIGIPKSIISSTKSFVKMEQSFYRYEAPQVN